MPTKIQLRRGTAAQWTTANPLLASGEVGLETDTRKFKIGDGSTAWTTLAYSSVTSAAVEAAIALHADRTDNPHSVTKAQIGLGFADNTSDADKPISTATQAALDDKYDASNPDEFVDAAGAASAAPVQSVAGRTGAVTISSTDISDFQDAVNALKREEAASAAPKPPAEDVLLALSRFEPYGMLLIVALIMFDPQIHVIRLITGTLVSAMAGTILSTTGVTE